jgi:RNA polymerase sigma-70 factor (ECF subfamily)
MLFRLRATELAQTLAVVGPDAGDAVQEAFVQAYLHWPKISRYDDPVAWIRRVAVNRMLNQRRSRRRESAAIEGLRLDGAQDTNLDETADRLRAAVSALPVQQRTATALFYLDELSVQEVAEAMGLSAGAVKYHLHAARNALRLNLEIADGV